MANMVFIYDIWLDLCLNKFTRAGYTFQGWARTASGAAAFADGADVRNLTATAGETVTLFAKWTAITYTVAYNTNGGSGSMASVTHTFDVAKALAANTFTRAGCTFIGWNTAANGTGIYYTNSQNVINLLIATGTITLFAQWRVTSTIDVMTAFGYFGSTYYWDGAVSLATSNQNVTQFLGTNTLRVTGNATLTFNVRTVKRSNAGSRINGTIDFTLRNSAGTSIQTHQTTVSVSIVNAVTINSGSFTINTANLASGTYTLTLHSVFTRSSWTDTYTRTLTIIVAK
jgi:uncharacterized repeat protein (TIGR02543 family)